MGELIRQLNLKLTNQTILKFVMVASQVVDFHDFVLASLLLYSIRRQRTQNLLYCLFPDLRVKQGGL